MIYQDQEVNDEDFIKAVEQLEDDMRRYIYDKTPDRRSAMLTRFRERLGLNTWLEFQDARFAKAEAAYLEQKDNPR